MTNVDFVLQMLQRDIAGMLSGMFTTEFAIVNIIIMSIITCYVTMFFDRVTLWVNNMRTWILSGWKNFLHLIRWDMKKTVITFKVDLQNGTPLTWNGTRTWNYILAICHRYQENAFSKNLPPIDFSIDISIDGNMTGTRGKQLKKCKHVYIPTTDVLIESDVWFSMQQIFNPADKDGNVTSSIAVTLSTTKSIKHLDDFLNQVKRDFYIHEKKTAKNIRYYYTREKDNKWKRYALTKNRTFNSVFFNEKEQLLRILNDFTGQTGIFKFESVTRGIGILLYGPPGTGKSSLIKVLAANTGRHLINLNLQTIKTNSELREIFYGVNLKAENKDKNEVEYYVPLNKRIVIFEDIDCISDVVKKREGIKKKIESQYEIENKCEKMDEFSVAEKIATKMESYMKAMYADDDMLNLGSLLDILQGTIDNQDMIWILTTNCVEMLDPALIRPGRITLRINLSFVNENTVRDMFNYYYPETGSKYDFGFVNVDHEITPATIENLFVTDRDPESVIQKLREMFTPKIMANLDSPFLPLTP